MTMRVFWGFSPTSIKIQRDLCFRGEKAENEGKRRPLKKIVAALQKKRRRDRFKSLPRDSNMLSNLSITPQKGQTKKPKNMYSKQQTVKWENCSIPLILSYTHVWSIIKEWKIRVHPCWARVESDSCFCFLMLLWPSYSTLFTLDKRSTTLVH